jgi:hypothetical protein
MKRLACCALLLAASTAFAENKKAADAKKPTPDQMQQMMAQYELLAKPGPQHQWLVDMAGTWATSAKMWMEPGKAPMESTGTEEAKAVLGGRFVTMHFNGTMMGKPFEGMGMVGFDNIKKKFVMTWADSMGTMMIYAEGTGDQKERTFTGEEELPNGQKHPFRWVIKVQSKDQHTMEMWAPGMDGKEAKQMEIVYKRAVASK